MSASREAAFKAYKSLYAVIFGLCEGPRGIELSAIGDRSLVGRAGIMHIVAVHSCQDLPLVHVIPEVGIYLFQTAIRQHAHSPGRIVGKSNVSRQTEHGRQVAHLNGLDFYLLC